MRKLIRSISFTACTMFLVSSINALSAEDSSSFKKIVHFEWEPVPGAKSYDVELKLKNDPTTTKPYNFNVSLPSFNGKLRPGLYLMRLRSHDSRDVPGEWSNAEELEVPLDDVQKISPSNEFNIIATSDSTQKIEFTWKAVPLAEKYKFTLLNSENKIINENVINGLSTSIELPVANSYKWKVQAIGENDWAGAVDSTPWSLTVTGRKLSKTNIIEPETRFVRKVSWTPVPFAKSYNIVIYKKSNNPTNLKTESGSESVSKSESESTSKSEWEKVKEETDLTKVIWTFPKNFSGGLYKLEVVATAPQRVSSDVAEITFDVIDGDRSLLTENKFLIRESIDRTKSWYFIASYLATQIKYQATNYDTLISPKYQAFGGTGRLGLGYLQEDGPWGFLGIVDLSGFILNKVNYTYGSTEVHGVYRLATSALSELRLSSGVFAKQLPQIVGSNADGQIEMFQLLAAGPHIGIEYWYSLSKKLGIQINTRLYSSLFGKTPNGLDMDPAMSYQFGFLGSYKLKPKLTGLVGYALRKDAIQYKTINQDLFGKDTVNESSVEGHYINFFLEWDI